jgi:hypothetical protein
MQFSSGSFPRADAAPKWEVLGQRDLSKAIFHWQYQLGTTPYTVQKINVITVNYGPAKL